MLGSPSVHLFSCAAFFCKFRHAPKQIRSEMVKQSHKPMYDVRIPVELFHIDSATSAGSKISIGSTIT
jgi:hypothetical protein